MFQINRVFGNEARRTTENVRSYSKENFIFPFSCRTDRESKTFSRKIKMLNNVHKGNLTGNLRLKKMSTFQYKC